MNQTRNPSPPRAVEKTKGHVITVALDSYGDPAHYRVQVFGTPDGIGSYSGTEPTMPEAEGRIAVVKLAAELDRVEAKIAELEAESPKKDKAAFEAELQQLKEQQRDLAAKLTAPRQKA